MENISVAFRWRTFYSRLLRRLVHRCVGAAQYSELHELLLGTLRTQNVRAICDETFANKRRLAHCADEAVVVPVTVFKRDESGAANSGDWSTAGYASLSKQFAKAVGTVRLVLSGGEALTSKACVAVRATKALSMPWLVSVCYSSTCDDLVALNTSCSVFLLITASAVNVVITRDEAFGSNRIFAHTAAEAFLMPLMSFVFHFLSSCPEHFTTAIATCGKRSIIAVSTVDFLCFRAKWFVN